MKILLAHDGSRRADDALADLSRAGLPDGSEAVVLSVAEAWVGPAESPDAGPDSPAGAARQAAVDAALVHAGDVSRAAAEALRARFPSWTVTSESKAGSPAWEIVRRADALQPDLLVVGATGRSGFERVMFGTVAALVLGHARCSVRVARSREDASGPVRLVVAVDGSAGSRLAVEAAARRRWPDGSEALVVEALDDWTFSLRAGKSIEPSQDAKDAVTLLARSGLAATALVGTGDPKRVLLDQASSWRADGIFVGARGLRTVERFLLGSVPTAIASRAACSVEVVRG